MNDDTDVVSPMVMKAARKMSAFIAEHMGDSFENVWAQAGRHHINIAQAALTDCGALECLEALKSVRCCVKDGSAAGGLIDAAIAKATAVEVCGSAP